MSHSRATARAHPNIALVKYWGKRDPVRILPHQSSLSVTLAPLEVVTTVEFGAPADSVVLHGSEARGKERSRVLGLLERVRSETTRALGPVRVDSRGNFPMAAGLASSAAGFAALALAGAGGGGAAHRPGCNLAPRPGRAAARRAGACRAASASGTAAPARTARTASPPRPSPRATGRSCGSWWPC